MSENKYLKTALSVKCPKQTYGDST